MKVKKIATKKYLFSEGEVIKGHWENKNYNKIYDYYQVVNF
jgi:hypothetical protein